MGESEKNYAQQSEPVVNPGSGVTVMSAGRSRRNFLKAATKAAVVGAGLVSLPLGAAKLLAQAGDFVVTIGFPASGEFLSSVQAAGVTFNAIGTYWEVNSGDANLLKVQIRVGDEATKLGDWVDAPSDTFEGRPLANQTRFFGRIQFLKGNFVQFRLEIPAGLSVKLVGLTFIDSNAGPVPLTPPQPLLPPGKPTKPYIISRAAWGANEGWRYTGGQEIWGREYRTPKVMFVHHSETSNTYDANPATDVRGIYQYHALTKGWGDIGYNYLVDWKGNIYEGRAGGDDVVAGHAFQYNWGSIGICLIGSFKSTAPSKAMIDSLVKLLAWKASTKGINPLGKAFLVDRTLSCICGHRDGILTSCPGDACYAVLPQVRQRVAEVLDQPGAGEYNVSLKSISFSPASVKVGETLKIEAVITNTGSRPLETQEPAPGYTYEEGQTFETEGLDKVPDKFRLAVDFAGNKGVSHPYRWGLGRTLQPGESATIIGFIKMQNKRQFDIFGGVIHEYVKYFEDNIGTTRISVIANGPNPTARAASRAADPNIRYFNETGHNLGYTFRRYWEKNGGLAMFGFPLTEEFEEPSDTEPGKSYVVQYFQRNRFEYHPEYRGTNFEVLLGLLGVQLTEGRDFPKGSPIPTTSEQIYFGETGHSLRGPFYRYWKALGGLAIFGFPISEEFEERNPDDGKTYSVQYFERNRFEYHPEYRGTQYEVLLGLLGTELCRRKDWL